MLKVPVIHIDDTIEPAEELPPALMTKCDGEFYWLAETEEDVILLTTPEEI